MTLTISPKDNIFPEQKEFYSNTNYKWERPVIWNKINLNNPNMRHVLFQLVNDKVDNASYFRFLSQEVSLTHDFKLLFMLTTLGRLTLNFIEFCKLVSIFSGINEQYRRRYDAAGMFKNMIYHTSSGENFPIHSPEELVYKLETFNGFVNQGTLTYFDILDCASDDVRKSKIKRKEYVNVIYMIMKAAYKAFGLRSFEQEICKRALVIFQVLRDKKHIAEFRRLLYSSKKKNG